MVDQNQIVVAAMGNERRYGSPTSWPAAYPGVIAVGALDYNDAVAPFSNGGPHIAVSAPGVDILATMPTYKGVEHWTGRRDASGAIVRDKPVHWTVYRGTMRGTSMAAPQVAGAAALWVAKHGRDPAGFREAIVNGSRNLSSMGGVVPHPDYGYGCLDIEDLL
jgi:subtilisin family serine protease